MLRDRHSHSLRLIQHFLLFGIIFCIFRPDKRTDGQFNRNVLLRQITVQFFEKFCLGPFCPFAAPCIHCDRNLSSVGKIFLVNGAPGEFIDNGLLVFSLIFIIPDQRTSICIFSFNIQYSSGTAQRDLHFRINLHMHASIFCINVLIFIYTEYSRTDRCGNPCGHADHIGPALLSVLGIHDRDDFIRDIARLISGIGSFDKTSLIIQDGHISTVCFHYQISRFFFHFQLRFFYESVSLLFPER